MIKQNRLLFGVELTRHCNLRCLHCLRENRTSTFEFDDSLFRSIVSQAAMLGKPNFAFSGGEPTLHTKLVSFLRILADHELPCHIVTNGSHFADLHESFQRFKGTLTAISVSLDGIDEKTHDALRGRGSFRTAMMAIALAVRAGFEVTVQCVVCRLNRHQLEDMAKLCDELGVSLLLFAYLFPVPRAVKNKLPIAPDEWTDVEQEIEALIQCGPLPIGISTGHRDPVPFAHCESLRHLSYNIDSHGQLTFCCQLSGAAGVTEPKDVVADLREVPLLDALERHMEMAARLVQTRMRYRAANPDDPHRDFHCHFCFNHFEKTIGSKEVLHA